MLKKQYRTEHNDQRWPSVWIRLAFHSSQVPLPERRGQTFLTALGLVFNKKEYFSPSPAPTHVCLSPYGMSRHVSPTLSQLPGEPCRFSNHYLGRRHVNTEQIGVSLSTPAALFNVTAAVLFLAPCLSCSLQTQSVLCGSIALDKVNGRYGCILCKWTSGNEAMKEQKYSGCQQMAYHSICFQHRILTEVSGEKTVSLLARYLFTITCI